MADIGYTTAVGYGDTQGGSYSDIANIVEATLPDVEIKDVDFTNMQSASYFMEFIPGMGNAGEIEVKLLFEKTQQDTLYSLVRVTKWWRINFPLASGETTPSNWKCQGYLKGLKNLNPLDDKMELTCKMKLTGKPVWAKGS